MTKEEMDVLASRIRQADWFYDFQDRLEPWQQGMRETQAIQRDLQKLAEFDPQGALNLWKDNAPAAASMPADLQQWQELSATPAAGSAPPDLEKILEKRILDVAKALELLSASDRAKAEEVWTKTAPKDWGRPQCLGAPEQEKQPEIASSTLDDWVAKLSPSAFSEKGKPGPGMGSVTWLNQEGDAIVEHRKRPPLGMDVSIFVTNDTPTRMERIDLIRDGQEVALFVNPRGWFDKLPRNEIATALFLECNKDAQRGERAIYGNAVLVEGLLKSQRETLRQQEAARKQEAEFYKGLEQEQKHERGR